MENYENRTEGDSLFNSGEKYLDCGIGENQFDSNYIEEKGTGKYQIDLQKLALHQLVQNGFKREKITTLTECTYCDAEKYHSYRRNGKKAGRMIGLLGYC